MGSGVFNFEEQTIFLLNLEEQTILSFGGDLFVTMELLVVTFVFATTILSVPAEAGPRGYRHKTGPSGFRSAPGPGPTGYGNRDAARYPYKREAAESLEVDEGNADYDYDYKEGALAWPTAGRHHAGKSSLPAGVQQEKINFAQYGKRAAPTSMEAEYG